MDATAQQPLPGARRALLLLLGINLFQLHRPLHSGGG